MKVPFGNAFREWVGLNCDKNSDGQLSEDERTQCTKILLEKRNEITSLQGIEYFPNLKELNCAQCSLSSLDLGNNINLNDFAGYSQTISVPMYKNENVYYIDLSGLPLDLKKVNIDTAWMTEDGTTYNSTSGRINLSEPKDIGNTVRYSYETNGPDSLSSTKMTVILKISEVKDITEPTTEQPTTGQPTTEQPAVIVPPTTQTGSGKDPAPKTGDTMPLYPVISLLLVSFVRVVTLYIRRRKKL